MNIDAVLATSDDTTSRLARAVARQDNTNNDRTPDRSPKSQNRRRKPRNTTKPRKTD
jgi:hypothetical protein